MQGAQVLSLVGELGSGIPQAGHGTRIWETTGWAWHNQKKKKRKEVKCTVVRLWYKGTTGTSGLLTPGQFSSFLWAKLLHFSLTVSRDQQTGREENNVG